MSVSAPVASVLCFLLPTVSYLPPWRSYSPY